MKIEIFGHTHIFEDIVYKHALIKTLNKYEIPQEIYFFDGYSEEKVCIEKKDTKWIVYEGERGNQYNIKNYDYEYDACCDLISRVAEEKKDVRSMKKYFNSMLAICAENIDFLKKEERSKIELVTTLEQQKDLGKQKQDNSIAVSHEKIIEGEGKEIPSELEEKRTLENQKELSEKKNKNDETIPEFNVGDTVRVHAKIKEGNRERIQVFEGTVLKKQGSGVRATFTVRKTSNGIGVEKTWLIHSPHVEKIEVVRRGKVRRAKLNYLRNRVGKAAKLKEAIK